MIGQLEKTVLDCPDPRALAAFYAQMLGMRVNEESDDWVVIGLEPGARHDRDRPSFLVEHDPMLG